MGFSRITNADLNSRGATTLPNQPTISAANLKKEFDAPAKEVVAPAVNRLMGELEANSSSSNLGATPPVGRSGNTVQSVLNSISSDLATLESSVAVAIADAHTHSNKALLDTYTQTEADLAQAVADDHTHSNKALLDTYTQTESDLASAVADDHTHSNKALLDTYAQSETDLADAVSKKHDHSNKALLDTYTQTEANIADAVSKKHSHTNGSVLNDLSDDGSGNLLYDGNPVGGGSVNNAFKNIIAAGATITAVGEDTIEIAAGSNVVISTDTTTTPPKITIAATGGGTGSANWGSIGGTLSDQSDLNTALNGKANTSHTHVKADITDLPTIPTVTDTYSGTSSDGMSGKAVKSAIDALDVSDSAVSGQYVSAVSETDGKISVTRASLPSVPTITDTYSSTSHDGMSGVAVASAISGKANSSQLDGWTTASTVDSSGNVTFSGLNDSYGYELFFEMPTGESAYGYTKITKTGSGTSATLTYATNAPNGTSCKLRIIK